MNEKIRQEALIILTKNFPNDSPKLIYECAHEWSEKQVSTSGLVSYYKAYYNQLKESKKVA